MTLPEQQMRLDLVKDFKHLHMKPIENRVGVGTPDVFFIGGCSELKRILQWPARQGILKPHRYTNAQRIFLKEHWDLGGKSFLTMKIAEEWLVIAGPDAWPVGKVDCDVVRGLAILHLDRYRFDDLNYIFTAPREELEHLRSIKCTRTLALNHMKNFSFTASERA